MTGSSAAAADPRVDGGRGHEKGRQWRPCCRFVSARLGRYDHSASILASRIALAHLAVSTLVRSARA